MAEIYHWQASRNNIINNAPFRPNTPEWQQIIQDMYNHPMASRVRQGVVTASINWWENVDPTRIGQKDVAWRIGMGVGIAESIAVILAPPGSGMIRGLINMAAMQGWNLIADYLPTSWDPRVKSFFKGMSTGALYVSLPTILAKELFMGGISSIFENRPTASTAPEAKPTVVPSAPKPEVPSALRVTPPMPTVPDIESVVSSKTVVIESNPDFGIALAAKVGEKLALEDTIIDKTLRDQGRSITDLSPATLTAARKAIQHALENQANVSADGALRDLLTSNPNFDATKGAIDLAKTATAMRFDQWFNQPDSQVLLADVARKSLSEQFISADNLSAKVAKFVAENNGDHSLITEHIVSRGETAGHLVMSMDAPLTWDGTDWQGFAVLHALNPDAFADLRSAMGLSPQEFATLLQKIQAGDMESYRKLIQYMGKVNAGQKVTLLTPAGLRKLLAS